MFEWILEAFIFMIGITIFMFLGFLAASFLVWNLIPFQFFIDNITIFIRVIVILGILIRIFVGNELYFPDSDDIP